MSLSKPHRIRKEKEFKNVFLKGKTSRGDFLNIKIVENNTDISRFGFVVSVKISKKSVLRNKIKRRLRECARLNLVKIKPGFDIVIIAIKKDIINQSFDDICEETITLLKKSKIFND